MYLDNTSAMVIYMFISGLGLLALCGLTVIVEHIQETLKKGKSNG